MERAHPFHPATILRTLGLLGLCVVLLAAPLPASVEAVFDSLPGSSHRGEIRLLTDNHEAWYARWYAVEHAQDSIDCTYFNASNDLISRAFLGLLARKAGEGVKVRLMVDQRGALKLFNPIFHQDYLPAIASIPSLDVHVYNAYIRPFSKLPQKLLAGIASNHTKMLIVDGKVVVAGGRNLQVQWFASPHDFSHAYRDADVAVQGADVARQARKVFDREYQASRNLRVEPLPEDELPKVLARLETARATLQAHMTGRPLPDLPPAPSADEAEEGGALSEDTQQSIGRELEAFRSMTRYASFELFTGSEKPPIVVLGKSSAANGAENDITENLLRLIGAAEQEIVVGSAYLVLTERARAALQAAAARGVAIRTLTNSPESSNSMFTQAWFVKEWKDYLKDIPGMRLFAISESRKMHGKVLIFDGKVSVVGSYNIDPMSERINGEHVAVVRSATFARDLAGWLAEVRASSIEYKIRIRPDGRAEQVVGPSDHCSKWTLLVLRVIGWASFLRPLV